MLENKMRVGDYIPLCSCKGNCEAFIEGMKEGEVFWRVKVAKDSLFDVRRQEDAEILSRLVLIEKKGGFMSGGDATLAKKIAAIVEQLVANSRKSFVQKCCSRFDGVQSGDDFLNFNGVKFEGMNLEGLYYEKEDVKRIIKEIIGE